VVSAGFVSQEVPDVKDLPVFSRFMGKGGKGKGLLSIPGRYFQFVRHYTEFRENTMRYATFLGYLDQLRKGNVKHYGGSRKAVVDQLRRDMGNEVAAAHLSRNLIGDYGNISVAGNWIRRRLMPFWSFQEINLKRVPRLVVNAWEAGGAAKAGGTLSVAVARTLLTSRIAWLYGAIWAWNLLLFGDDEEELPPYDRANPHVLLGRNADGSIRVFRNVGALGDFLEWFGINKVLSMFGKLKAGQVDAKDIALEMAFAAPEKAMGSIRPDLKALYEIPTGQSLFPEPTKPRSARRGELAAGVFGLQDEYKWMRGKVLGDGSRPRNHYWQRWGLGVNDPRQAALSNIYDLRSDFLKKKGKEEKGTFPVSRYKEARDAAILEDYDAFLEWKGNFVAERGEKKARDDFLGFLRGTDPIASPLTNDDEIEFERDFLTNEQRGQLTVARQFAGELRDLLLTWWDASDQFAETSLKDKVLVSLAKTVAKPTKALDEMEEAERLPIDRAIAELRRMGVNKIELADLLGVKLKQKSKSGRKGMGWKAAGQWKRRLIRRLD